MGENEQEIEYRNLFESMEHGVIYHDSDGSILAMNGAAEKILNVSMEELTGSKAVDPHLTMVHEDLTPFPATEHPTVRAIHTGETIRNVVMGYWNTDDNDYRWVTVSAVPEFHEGESQPYRVFVTFTDITAQKKMEEALNNSEQNFRNLMDDSPLGIRIVNENGDTLYANRAMLNIYGYRSVNELLATSSEERYTPDSYNEHLERKEKRQNGDYVAPHYTVNIKRKDGEIRHLEVFRKPVVWNGESLYQVICNDITQRKRDEEELLLRAQLLDEANDSIALFNQDGTFLYVNDGFCRMHGTSKEEVIGTNIRQFTASASEEFLDDLDEQLKDTGHAVFEATHILPDGGMLDLEVHSTEIVVNDVHYNLSIERDITERKQIEIALHESEQNFRNSMDISPLGIIIKKDIATAVYCNQAALDLFGYESLEELNSSPVEERQFSETIPRLRERWEQINRGEFASTRDSYEIKRKDGEIRFVETFIDRIIWNGTPHIQFINHDVTERQRLDIERLALNGASKSVLTSTDFQSAAQRIFDFCREVTGATAGYVALLNEETNDNDVVYLDPGGLDCSVDPNLPMPVRGLRAEAYRTKQTVYENSFSGTE